MEDYEVFPSNCNFIQATEVNEDKKGLCDDRQLEKMNS
jgi:hypothetical protein